MKKALDKTGLNAVGLHESPRHLFCGQAVWAAIGLALGIWAGMALPLTPSRYTAAIPLLLASVLFGVLLTLRKKRRAVLLNTHNTFHKIWYWASITCLAGLVAGIAMGSATSVASNNFVLWPDEDRVLVSVTGKVASRPLSSSRNRAWSAEDLKVTRLVIDSARLLFSGEPLPIKNKHTTLICVVWVEGNLLGVQRGDIVRLQGWAKRPQQPQWPGAFDQVQWAKQRGIDLIIVVPETALIKVLDEHNPINALTWLRQLQDELHERAGKAAAAGLSPEAGGTVKALLLGQRAGPEFNRFMELLRRLGVAHLLAISGLHLAIAIGFVVAIARAAGLSQRGVGFLIIGVALLAVLLVEIRPPLLRAAAMATFLGASLVLGRGLIWTGTLAMAAIALLLFRPREVSEPGFQLSFGVVIGLIALTPAVIRRWLGPELQSISPPLSAKAWRWLVNLAAASLVAWIVATPLVAYHFKIFSPLAAPLGALLLLPITILMILGALHMTLGAFFGVVCPPISWTIEYIVIGLDWILTNIANWPGAWWPLPQIPAAICVLGLVWVVAWSLSPSIRLRRWLTVLGLVMYAGLVVSSILLGRSGPMRIDMFAVGDGSAYLLRSGNHKALFDAGSQLGPDIGPHTITPALHALGVRRLDCLILSHAHRDHISGSLNVIKEFKPRQLIVSSHFLEFAKTQGPHTGNHTAHHILEAAKRSGVPIQVVEAGASWKFGEATFTCLAPHTNEVYASHNDASLVLQIDVLGRRLLFCGDIEDQGIESLLTSTNLSDVDVVEAPHHGEESRASIHLMDELKPLFVLQSSKPSRDGQWIKSPGRIHLHTAHDGTCSILISKQGTIQAQRWAGPLEQEPHRYR